VCPWAVSSSLVGRVCAGQGESWLSGRWALLVLVGVIEELMDGGWPARFWCAAPPRVATREVGRLDDSVGNWDPGSLF
jgi:hypothetical protein